MEEKAFNLAKNWSTDPYIEAKDQEEIKNLLDSSDKEEVIDRFYQDLEFGTGGLRSIIGVGSNRMNKYNVRRATQAICNTVLKEKPNGAKAAISYDNRRFSKEFAQEVASVFAANGIKSYVYSSLTPTPMLSYAVRYYQADCGVMITASHNPKQYNGFKAYWNDGAQVTPPYDQNIIDQYNLLTNWDQVKSMDFQTALNDHLIEYVGDDCVESFYKIIENHVLKPNMCKEEGDKVHFIYTPLHGCGYIPCKAISQRLGFSNFEIVESQAVFDSEFSTLTSTPNPEDPEALALAVALMKEKNADVAYATDPDCDRLGVVVNHKGIEHYLNGNQIALLMLHYILDEKKQSNTLPANPLVIKSIVTSPMQKTISESFGATIMDTLTGFKWMARLLKDLEDKGANYDFVFASEESFGYMPNDQVRDKDAVASIALMNEITLHYKLQNKTLVDALDALYEKYGYAQESLIAKTYEGIKGKEKIARIMQYFRDHAQDDIAGNKVKIYQDFDSLKAKDFINQTESPIEMTKSNVLGFEFENGNILFLRPSGTEPKIKFYTMVQVKDGNLTEKKETAKAQIETIESFINQTIESI